MKKDTNGVRSCFKSATQEITLGGQHLQIRAAIKSQDTREHRLHNVNYSLQPQEILTFSSLLQLV